MVSTPPRCRGGLAHSLYLLDAVSDDERDAPPHPVPKNTKAQTIHPQTESPVSSPPRPVSGVTRRRLVCHPQLPQGTHLLRRISRQLQADRARHQAQCKEGFAMSSSQWCARPCIRSHTSIHLLLGVVSAPLWNSEKSKFAGMLTVLDIIHLIQYYYDNLNYEAAAADVETFRLELLRGVSFPDSIRWTLSNGPSSDIEKSLGVATPPMLREHPNSTLYDAAKLLIQTHARRLPLLDYDTETGHEVIVSVLTQYRLLKFISINVFFLPFYIVKLPSPFSPVHQRNTTSPPFPPQTQDRDIRL